MLDRGTVIITFLSKNVKMVDDKRRTKQNNKNRNIDLADLI